MIVISVNPTDVPTVCELLNNYNKIGVFMHSASPVRVNFEIEVSETELEEIAEFMALCGIELL